MGLFCYDGEEKNDGERGIQEDSKRYPAIHNVDRFLNF